MDPDVSVFFNPKCSKCRTARGLLEERGIEAELVEYLHDPPTRTELERILRLLGTDDPRAITRTGEDRYRELGLDGADRERAPRRPGRQPGADRAAHRRRGRPCRGGPAPGTVAGVAGLTAAGRRRRHRRTSVPRAPIGSIGAFRAGRIGHRGSTPPRRPGRDSPRRHVSTPSTRSLDEEEPTEPSSGELEPARPVTRRRMILGGFLVRWRELLVVVAVLTALAALVYGTHVRDGGFLMDDWSNAAKTRFLAACCGTGSTGQGAGYLVQVQNLLADGPAAYHIGLPVLIPFSFFAFRPAIAPHLALAVALGVLVSACMSCSAAWRRCTPASSLFPWSDANRLWAMAVSWPSWARRPLRRLAVVWCCTPWPWCSTPAASPSTSWWPAPCSSASPSTTCTATPTGTWHGRAWHCGGWPTSSSPA